MKKTIVFLLLVIASFFPPLIFAQENATTDSQSTDITTATQSADVADVSTDYTLPYPGLLPDSPLYFLKVTRDAIVGALITNAQKKASFDVLQADKRLSATKALLEKDKKKYKLAESTLSKGENYMEDAVLKIQQAKREGLETNELELTLHKAIRKHEEVIRDIITIVPKDATKGFADTLKRVTALEKKS